MDTPLPSPIDLPVTSQAASRLHLPGMTLDELRAHFAERGLPAFRANQVVEWVYAKGVSDFAQMTNLPLAMRSEMAQQIDIFRSTVRSQRVSADGTYKLLLGLDDDALTETVWIPDGERNTACLSSQVGCPVGCRFCASGIGGVERSLTAGEIVEQALQVSRLIAAARPTAEPGGSGPSDRSSRPGRQPRLSNIVMMGMGEPLANYAQVVRALRILNAPWGLNIGARRMTVSTVGLPRQIRQLADESLPVNLALSLHAPTDALRQALIPWGKVPIRELLDACGYYFERTGREITLEYVLLAGVNDHPEHARELANIARRLRANVNLLRYNPVPGAPYTRPTAADAMAFQELLRGGGVNAHTRRSRGRDIDAACGQLRRAASTAAHVEPDA